MQMEDARNEANPKMEELIYAIREFVAERDWAQYHSPKNLAMALSVEVAELMEPFQWLTPEQSDQLTEKQRDQCKQEIGDVLIYLVMVADRLHIDPLQAAKEKLINNRIRYPVAKVRGKHWKYNQYE